ncbi:MAG TPA: DUF3419 family protein [Candidatus Diapherotrites archaeon]|jgi:hypothetical protein|nr:DUF3419 family protein [Candidatus Diapherotrites archaeon]
MNFKNILNNVKNKKADVQSPIYIYGTEMISRYYSKIDMKNKTILTICGSGDQVINAFYYGAKKVDCYDINELSEYILNLKLTAISKLSFIDFITYFGYDNKKATLYYDIYLKFKKDLPPKTRLFFNEAYKYFNLDGVRLFNSPLFLKRSCYTNHLTDINQYLKSEKDYLYIKQILKNKKINFYHTDVLKLNQKIKTKYDIINLSNIPHFLYSFFGFDFDKLKQNILDLFSLINKKGFILIYAYSKHTFPNKNTSAPPLLTNIKDIKYFAKICNLNYKTIYFKSVNKSHKGFDKVILLFK